MRILQLSAMVALAACGGGGGANVTPDGGSAPDAKVTPDGAAPTADAGAELIDRLRALPGVTSVTTAGGPSGAKRYNLVFAQPPDEHAPGSTTFPQRASLLHVSDTAPIVVVTEGYFLTYGGIFSEPAKDLGANQLTVEHRFFEPSAPDPEDWKKLDIYQAATDLHRIVTEVKSLYPGSKVITTGASKSGMTSIFYRRFYPDDVDGTVAYVAPLSMGAPDPRYIDFVENAGPDPTCRANLIAFQRDALSRRATLEPKMLLVTDSSSRVVTWNVLGQDTAFEHAILELPFAFWQYSGANVCSRIPASTATDTAVFNFIDEISDFSQYADGDVVNYGAYYYQAATQLGFPQINEAHVADLLSHPGTDTASYYSPVGSSPTYDDGVAMRDVDEWVQSEGKTLMFIYGSYDPWSNAQFNLGGASDSYKFIVEGGNHGSKIADLATADRVTALGILKRWAGVSSLAKVPETAGEEDPGPKRRL